jgi:hypothetical protein
MNPFRLTQDARGNWRRQNLGLRTTPKGDFTKATFTFGKDFDAACKRVVLLEQMWSAIQTEWEKKPVGPHPVWSSDTYRVALVVARGDSPIHLDVPPTYTARPPGQRDERVAMWHGFLRELFPFLDIRLGSSDDREAAERGAERLTASAMREMEAVATANRVRGCQVGGFLHPALDAYGEYLSKKYGRTAYARTQANLIKLLKGHLDNQSLSAMTADRIETVLSYFARRPLSKYDNQPLAFYTCRNVLITFRAFLRWLNRSESFDWELPRAFDFPRVKISKSATDRVRSRRVFKRTELALLWQYALPWDRALMTLALNCGFSKAELSTLQTAEVVRVKGQTHIRRERVKTDAYGEWLLWEETVAALAYLKGLKKSDTPYAVVSKTGKPLNRLTRGGNENPIIANHWNRLLKRVRADYPDIPKLPFKCLRKTGANLVRRLAKVRPTELASMYLAHSERSDSTDKLLHHYTDRPWPLLHKTLRKLRRKLDGVFSAVTEPWAEQRQTISPLTRQRIRDLRAEGKTLKEIAAVVGLHWVTVGKYCREDGQGRVQRHTQTIPQTPK